MQGYDEELSAEDIAAIEAAFAEPKLGPFTTEQLEDMIKQECVCIECGRVYQWSMDDVAWQYEQSAFMPCGHNWSFLQCQGQYVLK